MTWAFLEQNAGVVRRGGPDGTVIGLDYVQLLTLADALGLPRAPLAELLPACELGMLDALSEN